MALAVSGQTYEIGVFGGGVNNIGDVGNMSWVRPSGLAFGAIFKWNKSKRYAWRGSIMTGDFIADDSKSRMDSRIQRGYRIKNSIIEYSAGLEFNFVEYNLHKLGSRFTPYLYTGLSYFRFDYNYFDNVGQLVDLNQRDGSMAVPMTVGFKWRFHQFFILGGEIGARIAFTDNLDASNPKGSNYERFRFGNLNTDDWYVFTGLTLTYTFRRKPCTDCFE